MYDYRSLKPRLVVTEHEVECPVQGCTVRVPRQPDTFHRDTRFRCPLHGIYISPGTFEYDDEAANLLWTAPVDLSLLERIRRAKRESRIARERSEDALTWNVFRYLERSDLLPAWLAAVTRQPATGAAELIYWSYSAEHHGPWPELVRARKVFGERANAGSEPDLIAVSRRALVFIETKLTATHNTRPRLQSFLQLDGRPSTHALEKYFTAADGWYERVFNLDPLTLAVQQQKYELMRYWLLGSWLAAQSGRLFYLLVISRAEDEPDLEPRFSACLHQAPGRRFLHTTWEQLYGWIEACIPPDADRDRLAAYLRHKTIGYEDGELKLAFRI